MNNLPLGNCWYLCLEPDACLCSICVGGADFLLFTYIYCIHGVTSEGASGNHIWSGCIISKLVLLNSGENVVHAGTTGAIPLTALSSQEAKWTSVSKGSCRSSFWFYLQSKGQSFHLSYYIRSTTWRNPAGLLHKTQQFPGMAAFHLNFPVQMVSVQGGTLSCLRPRSSFGLERCHCSPGPPAPGELHSCSSYRMSTDSKHCSFLPSYHCWANRRVC